ncbi:MAG: GYD domain-containing protein [Thermoplasmata archaeon]
MPYYITLINWTDQGIRNVKDSPKRAEAAKAAVERAGGTWHGLYYTMGQYDAVAIMEAPNDETVMSVLLAIGSQGSVRTTTLRAFPESEATKIIEGLP